MDARESLKLDDSRGVGRQAVRASVPEALWRSNEQFSKVLLEAISSHPITRHPLITQMESGNLDVELQREFHLEFGHAFAEVFTDALLHAMFKSVELEGRLGPLGKVSARFLLQLNVLDELGFRADVPNAKEYAGNPYLAHYLQFDATLRELGVSPRERAQFTPSPQARACRQTFTDTHSDYLLLIALLAVAESVFTRFCGPWAASVGRGTTIDVTSGYHSIHVEHDGKFIDDDHAEDSWYLLRQAAIPQRYAEIQARAASWLDTWSEFLDYLVEVATEYGRRARAVADAHSG